MFLRKQISDKKYYIFKQINIIEEKYFYELDFI